MNTTPELFPSAPSLPASAIGHQPSAIARQRMNGKPVFTVPTNTVLNLDSGFKHKRLCDGPTFSTGTACVYRCAFCYVPDMMTKLRPHLEKHGVAGAHEDIVIRRADAVATLRHQLTDRHGRPKFKSPRPSEGRGIKGEGHSHLFGPAVIYSSPLVDVAGNLDLVRETVEACKVILELTNWQIRLLSKSNLLPKVAEGLLFSKSPSLQDEVRSRLIYGVSTGTLDDKLAQAFEAGTPLVSKRLASLHWLQDHGFRTFGMICPSLPLRSSADYLKFAVESAAAIRAEKCEHVWAEVINVRGDSFTRTVEALENAGFIGEAGRLCRVMQDKLAWEDYARETFSAHVGALGDQRGPDGEPKLRFLQYATAASRDWWKNQQPTGAILL